MNERIQQLAEQAGCKVMDDGEWYIPSATGLEKIVYTKGIGLEKFAELIVRECAGIYSKIDNGNLHMGTDNYLEALHKTFFEVADAPVDNVDRILRTVRTRGVEHGQEETSKKV